MKLYVSHRESDIDGLMQGCSISNALAMEILQFCAEPSIWYAVCGVIPLSVWDAMQRIHIVVESNEVLEILLIILQIYSIGFDDDVWCYQGAW